MSIESEMKSSGARAGKDFGKLLKDLFGVVARLVSLQGRDKVDPDEIAALRNKVVEIQGMMKGLKREVGYAQCLAQMAEIEQGTK